MQLSHIIAHIALATAIVASTASPTDAAWGWMTESKSTNDVKSNSVAEVLHVKRNLGNSARQDLPYQDLPYQDDGPARIIHYTKEEMKKREEEREAEKKRKAVEDMKLEEEAERGPGM